MKVIEVQHLHKRFNGFVAVDSISFSVERGEFFGLLGPNGAGKTTTIRMLDSVFPLFCISGTKSHAQKNH